GTDSLGPKLWIRVPSVDSSAASIPSSDVPLMSPIAMYGCGIRSAPLRQVRISHDWSTRCRRPIIVRGFRMVPGQRTAFAPILQRSPISGTTPAECPAFRELGRRHGALEKKRGGPATAERHLARG